jgi:hypothetical protein
MLFSTWQKLTMNSNTPNNFKLYHKFVTRFKSVFCQQGNRLVINRVQ